MNRDNDQPASTSPHRPGALPRQRTPSRSARWWLLALALVTALWFGWDVRVMIVQERYVRMVRACNGNLGTLAVAMMMYLADHDQTFPPAPSWCDGLAAYVPDRNTFVCPAAKNQICSYAFSTALGGVKVDAVADPEHTVMLLESDRGWNAVGGPELLPERPRHTDNDRYALINGGVIGIRRRPTEGVGVGRAPQKVPQDERVLWTVVTEGSERQLQRETPDAGAAD